MFEMPVRRTYELLGDQFDELRKNKKVKLKVSGNSQQPRPYKQTHDIAVDQQ